MSQKTTEKETAKTEQKPHRSKGEKLFDWLVYGGIAGVGTFLITVPLAYLMKYKGGDAWLVKQLAKTGLKEGGVVTNAVVTTDLMHGGNAMLVPVYFAEKNREKIIDDLNRATGDETPISEIAPKPKQTALSIFTSRLAAWGAVFSGLFSASMLFPKTFDTFENEFGQKTARMLGKTQYRPEVPSELLAQQKDILGRLEEARQTLGARSDLKAAMAPLKAELKTVQQSLSKFETLPFRLGKIGALDVFATITATSLLYMGNYFFGNLINERGAKPAADRGGSSAKASLRSSAHADGVLHEQSGQEKASFAERIRNEKLEAAESRGAAQAV